MAVRVGSRSAALGRVVRDHAAILDHRVRGDGRGAYLGDLNRPMADFRAHPGLIISHPVRAGGPHSSAAHKPPHTHTRCDLRDACSLSTLPTWSPVATLAIPCKLLRAYTCWCCGNPSTSALSHVAHTGCVQAGEHAPPRRHIWLAPATSSSSTCPYCKRATLPARKRLIFDRRPGNISTALVRVATVSSHACATPRTATTNFASPAGTRTETTQPTIKQIIMSIPNIRREKLNSAC